ncbi:MAG TPA: LLM class flavin-dependent oxidoreductase [Dehalococcoidia bacterium]|nr:LLM class flavin-dependent oxidoreductase [Dehalococcoidia bacterium]
MPQVFLPAGTWNLRAGQTPEAVLETARRAEAAGIDGVFAGDHISFHGLGNDGLMNLAPIAAVTSRLLLRTSVYLLPLRHPLEVALQCAMLDHLSGGRFSLGVGVGGEDPREFEAMGIDPRRRGRRMDEALHLLQRLWTEDSVSYHGRHFRLEDVGLEPKPAFGVRVFIGGRSDAALRRAGRYGDGWTGLWVSVRRFIEAKEKIAEAAMAAGRDPADIELGLQVWVGVNEEPDVARALLGSRMEDFYRQPFESFERYAPYGPAAAVAESLAPYVEAGARHLHLIPGDTDPSAVLEAAVAVRDALRDIVAGS